MPDTSIRQRLEAILAADAAGYSRLMAADERATVAALDAARAVFRTQIESNQGHVIDMAGDSVLAVFETANGAVSAALAIQHELNASSNAVPEDRRMRFRIGVHLGDLMEKADRTVYGDGVNIAARLQALAEPGGITVSESIRTAVKGKVSAGFEDLGEQAVKNIPDPVHAYRVRVEGAEAKQKAKFKAEVAKRDAELKKREGKIEQRGGGKKITLVMIAGIAAAVVAIGVGVYFGLKPDTSAREAELLKMLEEAKRANTELMQAKQQEKEIQKAVEQAREQEAAAKASGDVAKQRELAEQTRRREAEAQKQSELIKIGEAEAQKQAGLNMRWQEELSKLAEARKAAEKVAGDMTVLAQAALDKAAAEKAAADKATAQKEGAAKAAAEKLAADKAAAEKAAADKATAQKEGAAKAAAEKLAADKAAAEKAAADKVPLATVAIAAAEPSMQKGGAQSWAYRIETPISARRSNLAHITLEDKGGKTILRIVGVDMSVPCNRGDLDATVIRTDSTTTITAVSDLRGCEAFRLVIRNDGTGGQQQIKTGADWVSDGFDHGLTPIK